MRKIEKKMVEALRTGRALNLSNTCVARRQRVSGGYYQAVYLHGNEIARLEYNHERAQEPFAIMATLAGWGTVTTRSRLNAITREFTGRARFGQKNFAQTFDGEIVNVREILPVL
jgi:hypothetical protein